MIDRVGMRFGRLTIIAKSSGGLRKCRCDCGVTKNIRWNNLQQGASKSCGCLSGEQHGLTSAGKKSGMYWIWQAMLQRCYNKSRSDYPRYGGRGIRVCKRWRESFSAFLADIGERPHGKSLDRYPDNNGDYKPGNVRWATAKQQRHNRRDSLTTGDSDT